MFNKPAVIEYEGYSINIFPHARIDYPNAFGQKDSCILVFQKKNQESAIPDTLVYYPFGSPYGGLGLLFDDQNSIRIIGDSTRYRFSSNSIKITHDTVSNHSYYPHYFDYYNNRTFGSNRPFLFISYNNDFIIGSRDNINKPYRILYDSSCGIIKPKLRELASSKDRSIVWKEHSQYGNIVILDNHGLVDTLVWHRSKPGGDSIELFFIQNADSLFFTSDSFIPFHSGPSKVIVKDSDSFECNHYHGDWSSFYDFHSNSTGKPMKLIMLENRYGLGIREKIHINTIYLPITSLSNPSDRFPVFE